MQRYLQDPDENPQRARKRVGGNLGRGWPTRLVDGSTVGTVLCGGNIDPAQAQAFLYG